MRHALRLAGSRFTARRMVQNYVQEYYAPAIRGETSRRRSAHRLRRHDDWRTLDEPPAGARTAERSRSVVHVTAEYFPYARTGGLAEAVSGLAALPARRGSRRRRDPAALPHRARRGPTSSRSASRSWCPIGGRHEEARVFRVGGPGHRPAGVLHRAPRVLQPPRHLRRERRRLPRQCTAASPSSLSPRCTALPRLVHGPDPAPRPRLAHRAGPGVPPHHPRATSAPRGAPRTVRVGPQSRVPGPLRRPRSMPEIGLPWELYNWQQLEWYGKVNFLKGGLAFADLVTTVSPTQAKELRTAGGGFGLHDLFIALGDRLVGVLNGIDQRVWNPATDTQITAQYSADKLEGKRTLQGRAPALLRAAAAAPRPAVRHDRAAGDAEGARSHPAARPSSSASDAQFVFLGSGEPRYEQRAGGAGLVRAQPDRRAARLHRPARAPADGRRRHLPHALAVRALRPHPDAGAAVRRAADRPAGRRPGRHGGGRRHRLRLRRRTRPRRSRRPASARSRAYADAGKWQAMVRRAMARDFSWERSVDHVPRGLPPGRRPRGDALGPTMDFVLALHSHLPYVLNHGRWPHGSDWLCEAALDTYLPLIEQLRALWRPSEWPRRSPSASRRSWPTSWRVRPSSREMEAFFAQRLMACDEARDVARRDRRGASAPAGGVLARAADPPAPALSRRSAATSSRRSGRSRRRAASRSSARPRPTGSSRCSRATRASGSSSRSAAPSIAGCSGVAPGHLAARMRLPPAGRMAALAHARRAPVSAAESRSTSATPGSASSSWTPISPRPAARSASTGIRRHPCRRPAVGRSDRRPGPSLALPELRGGALARRTASPPSCGTRARPCRSGAGSRATPATAPTSSSTRCAGPGDSSSGG